MAKAQLPFRMERCVLRGYPYVVLHYEGRGPQGKTIPFTYAAGAPLEDQQPGCVTNPLGTAIMQLMKMYWDLESAAEPICSQMEEKDRLIRRLEGEKESLEASLRQLRSAHKK